MVVIRARKRFGQHFLEPAWVDKVVRAIAPQPDEAFLEIGPGHGALSRPLAARAKAVIAYEVDRDLAAELRETAAENVTVIEGDFLTLGTDDAGVPTGNAGLRTGDRRSKIGGRPRAGGHLPFYVASPSRCELAELYSAGLPIADSKV